MLNARTHHAIAKMYDQWDYVGFIVINKNVVNHVEKIYIPKLNNNYVYIRKLMKKLKN